MRKISVSWRDVDNYSNLIIQKMFVSNWKPDYIVGIARGGLIPATIISYKTSLPLVSLDASRHSMDSFECLAFAGDDAAVSKQNILVVDDTVKTGEILNHLVDDWESSASNSNWDDVWNVNVRFACLFEHSANCFNHVVDYAANEVCNQEEIVFPWQ